MRKWKPSKSAAREFAQRNREIDEFCAVNGINRSRNGDSYYFTIDGQAYRVSNHTVEASNAGATDWKGEQVREKYHESGRKADTIYIHASKLRIVEIFNALKAGKKLDGRGYVVED